jgi:magnesium/cobalt transport protein CorA
MEIFQLLPGQPPIRHNALEHMPDEGFIWLDFTREQAQGWEEWPRRLLNVEVDLQHLEDSMTPSHGSFFDGTSEYDMLIFQGLGPNDDPFPLETRTAAFFMFERLLVTVRAEDNISFHLLKQKMCGPKGKSPRGAVGLAYYILDTMVDRYLKVREVLDARLTELQDVLLSPNNDHDDWRALLDGRRFARRLETLSEDQLEALDGWRRNTIFDWDDKLQVRVRDLVDHVTRVRNHVSGLERDLEAAVQIHFSAQSQRQNEIMKVFTVVSVVFMPMMLLTGIWGMNFKNMPELEWPAGYFIALFLIFGVGVATFIWFRWRKFF